MAQSIVLDRQGSIANHVLSRKGPCRVATTANIALFGVQTIDGVAVDADDRVLVKDQENGLNGIYLAKTGDWELAADFNHGEKVVRGCKVFVIGGATHGLTDWLVSSEDGTFPGRETINFAQWTDAAIAAHVADASAAHAASAISVTPTGSISSTNAQDALAELDSEKAAASHSHASADITDFTEAVQDVVGGLLPASEGVGDLDWSYDDGTGTLQASIKTGAVGPDELAATAVTPGSYTNTNLTVDADGRITAAANGSASGGGATLIASGAITDDATLDIPLDGDTWDEVEIILIDIVPATDNVSLNLLFDQGSGFLTGVSDYQWSLIRGAVSVPDAADSEITLIDAVGNATNERVTIKLHLYRPGDADFIKAVHWTGGYRAQNAAPLNIQGWGELILNDDAITDARLLFSSGNIATGYYYALGKKF